MTRFATGRYPTYATLFDIQRFSVHDGPGREVQFREQKCIMCGRCTVVCTRGCHTVEDGRRRCDRASCVSCGACAAACPSEAMTLAGKDHTVEEVLEVVARDVPFYLNAGGGLTCSGGEPMLQIDFLQRLLNGAWTLGLHTAVDTAGNVPFRFFEEILPVTDLFLYDIKCIELLTFHRLGGGKYDLLGRIYSARDLVPATKEEMTVKIS